MPMPLRFNISDWHQLCKVQSNNSRQLSITVQDLVSSNILTGLLIQVMHADYGCLFSCVVEGSGSLLTENAGHVHEFTTAQILAELYKYGFDVTYNPRAHLPGSQVNFLMSLKPLGYDKLRVLNVWAIENGVRTFKWYVVAFNLSLNPNWINNGYAARESEFLESLRNGSAVNVSAIKSNMYPESHNWSWSWLDYIASIDDILSENA